MAIKALFVLCVSILFVQTTSACNCNSGYTIASIPVNTLSVPVSSGCGCGTSGILSNGYSGNLEYSSGCGKIGISSGNIGISSGCGNIGISSGNLGISSGCSNVAIPSGNIVGISSSGCGQLNSGIVSSWRGANINSGLSNSYIGSTNTNGGGFAVTVSSPIIPTGISVISENVIDGTLTVVGELPLLSAVDLNGLVPTSGSVGVEYGCGSGDIGIISNSGANGYGAGYSSGISGIRSGPVFGGCGNIGIVENVGCIGAGSCGCGSNALLGAKIGGCGCGC